jgi:hypothetical protein
MVLAGNAEGKLRKTGVFYFCWRIDCRYLLVDELVDVKRGATHNLCFAIPYGV